MTKNSILSSKTQLLLQQLQQEKDEFCERETVSRTCQRHLEEQVKSLKQILGKEKATVATLEIQKQELETQSKKTELQLQLSKTYFEENIKERKNCQNQLQEEPTCSKRIVANEKAKLTALELTRSKSDEAARKVQVKLDQSQTTLQQCQTELQQATVQLSLSQQKLTKWKAENLDLSISEVNEIITQKEEALAQMKHQYQIELQHNKLEVLLFLLFF